MSWKSILISHPSRLSLKDQQLVIAQQDTVTIPLEDIAVIVIEHYQVTITAALLSKMGELGTTLIVSQPMPTGQWLPFMQYHRQLPILQAQINASLPLQKQLWKAIVSRKILNQAKALSLSAQAPAALYLVRLATRVRPGDPDNLEAQAAAYYFSHLFGENFNRRQDPSFINASLNYGYSIMRSAVARGLALHGLLPTLGIHHCNQLNAFNLADDLIEPLRPVVDTWVAQVIQTNPSQHRSLQVQDKQALIRLLNVQMRFKQQNTSVLNAIDGYCASFQQALVQKDYKQLLIPDLIPLQIHAYE